MRAHLSLALITALTLSSPAFAAPEKSPAKKKAQSSSAKKSSAKQKSSKAKKSPADKKAKVNVPTQKLPKGFKQALVFQSMMVFDKAIPLYEKAIKDDPKFVSSYNNMAQCLIKRNGKNDKKAAQVYLNKALSLEPKNLGSLHTKALLCESNKKYDDAEECYREILEQQPLNFRAVQNLSELLFRTGKRREARKVLTTVLKKNPPDQHKKVYQQALKNLDKKIKEKSKQKTG